MWTYILVGGFFAFVVVPVFKTGFKLSQKNARKRARGSLGEEKVNRSLKKFKGRDFARFKDVMLPYRNKTSQIDNILVSRYGIFVVETKNYAGVVKGFDRSPTWLQILPGKKKEAREFYNPILQNEGHIKALRSLLYRSYPKLQYHNIVAFSDDCRIPRIPGVVKMGDLNRALKGAMVGQPVLSEKDVAAIKEIIQKSNIKDFNSRSEHVSRAQYAAARAKEREKQEAKRERAEANRPMAMQVQEMISRAGREGYDPFESVDDSRAPLGEQIESASKSAGGGPAVGVKEEKTPENER